MRTTQSQGKFLWSGDTKVYLKGVTYGTFPPGADGSPYPDPSAVAADFALMRSHGINAVRTYTAPPRWLLDLADDAGLAVLVGIAWEQHVAFLDEPERVRSITERVREAVRACAGHPAVCAYAIGNEIPTAIVRWHGRRQVEGFLERLYRAAKEEDPGTLVTYVNYPSTEYLELPFLDFLCFNVFLEAEEELRVYLAHLQNLAGDRPLLVGEIGLDSMRNGEEAQADSVAWQVRTAFASGCAGAFVFSWTDEWHRGGVDVEDWGFGLTRADRMLKPALTAVESAFDDVPLPRGVVWPSVSVVVCTYNGAATIAQCLASCARLDYPEFEVIVVDDGSTDQTAAIVAEFDVRLVTTQNQGLAAARNVGLERATGDIVAYLDDDAWPDPEWLRYLAAEFMSTPHAAIGGPNVPPTDGFVHDCIARAPGGPIHVLVSDREAEHIPGCNMAFRRGALEHLGGFDERFRIAGDDVDVCWRLQNAGWTIGFAPAAMVWHRRRGSIRAYLRQQREYGKAEAQLERKWPERYNRGGHVQWSGDVYEGRARYIPGRRRWRIYYGTWGTGLFQSVYQRAPGTLASLPLMPEWYLLIAALAAITVVDAVLEPLFGAVPGLGIPFAAIALLLAVLALAREAARGAKAAISAVPSRRPHSARTFAVVTALHLLQPLVRLWGRLRHGLTPWRTREAAAFALPVRRERVLWSETWMQGAERLTRIEATVRLTNAAVVRGSHFDSWDLEARVGVLGAARLQAGTEEHGQGRQLVRFRVWPRVPAGAVAVFVLAASLCGLEAYRQSVGAALVFAALALAIAIRIVRECSAAVALLLNAPFEQASSGVTEAPELPVTRPPHPRDAGVAIERGPTYFRADGRR